jgi:hypothetical protein
MRAEYAHQLIECAKRLYQKEVKQNMSSLHSSALLEGINSAALEYSEPSRLPNNIFSRAACIGYLGAKTVPGNNMAEHKALARTIFLFLLKEGANLSPGTDKHKFFRDICDTTMNRGLQALHFFIKIEKVIACHWVCAKGNYWNDFKDKLCHCPPVNIGEVRGVHRDAARQPKEADSDKTKPS